MGSWKVWSNGVFWNGPEPTTLHTGCKLSSNMLYSGALRAAGRLYGDPRCLKGRSRSRKRFWSSHGTELSLQIMLLRQNGALVFPNESTEVCQYYAFFFDIATPESHPWLFRTLLEEFGPERKQTKRYPEVAFANAFIGNYLRLDILSRYGYHKEVLQNIEGYFLLHGGKDGDALGKRRRLCQL